MPEEIRGVAYRTNSFALVMFMWRLIAFRHMYGESFRSLFGGKPSRSITLLAEEEDLAALLGEQFYYARNRRL
ncbi:MAG: hypothetical protein ACLVHE_04555 [Dialister invisus]